MYDNQELINDIKQAIVEMHEEAQIAHSMDNPLHANGLAQGRILLEAVLIKHNISVPRRIANVLDSDEQLTVLPFKM